MSSKINRFIFYLSGWDAVGDVRNTEKLIPFGMDVVQFRRLEIASSASNGDIEVP